LTALIQLREKKMKKLLPLILLNMGVQMSFESVFASLCDGNPSPFNRPYKECTSNSDCPSVGNILGFCNTETGDHNCPGPKDVCWIEGGFGEKEAKSQKKSQKNYKSLKSQKKSQSTPHKNY
jgi:hypothetical protein